MLARWSSGLLFATLFSDLLQDFIYHFTRFALQVLTERHCHTGGDGDD